MFRCMDAKITKPITIFMKSFHLYVQNYVISLYFQGTEKKSKSTKRVFQVFGCVVTSQDMVSPKDTTKSFSKAIQSIYFPN